MGKMLTNEEFLIKLEDMNIMYTPLEQYKGMHTKIKWKCPNNKNHVFEAEPRNIYDGKQKCPYCSRRKVFVGETDMWSTSPGLAQMLFDKNDGYKYFDTGSQKVDWVCPNCGHIIKDKIINNVKSHGLFCPVCSDGMSFGEKFIYELLNQLNCDFIYDKTTEWSRCKRYDFYVQSMSLIIEVHGAQHYEDNSMFCKNKLLHKTLNDEIENDKLKMKMAIDNGVLHYIQLDCRKSDFDYIKQSVIDSELDALFDLSCIDWDKCFKATITSNIILCADLWNGGMKNTKDISEYTGIHISSVISNLKKAAKSGLCDYVVNYKKLENKDIKLKIVCNFWNSGIHNVSKISELADISKSYATTLLKIGRDNNMCNYCDQRGHNGEKPLLCVETGCVYNSIASVKKYGYNPSSVSNCCNGKIETYKGMHWKFI